MSAPSAHRPAMAGFLVAALVALGCNGLRSGSAGSPVSNRPPVVLDGAFEDWSGLPTVAARTGPAGAANGAELVAARERNDGRYVYLQIDLARPVNLLGFDGTLALSVDADGDESTGTTVDGLAGTDFSLDLSPTAANGRLVEGVALHAIGKGGADSTVDSYGLDFATQPSYEASRFELRMARGRRLGNGTAAPTFVGRSYRAQLVVRLPDHSISNRLPVFSAQLAPLDTATRVVSGDPLARRAGTDFRALVWNVANEGILERPDHFRRVIAAAAPDLVIMNETGGVIGRQRVGEFLATLGGEWHYTYGAAGGYQRTVIASRSSVVEFPELAFIPFPDSAVRPWLSLVPQANQQRERDSLKNGVATGGALVTIGGHRLAVFGVDLQSAGNRRGSWQDVRRTWEAKVIRDHAVSAIRSHAPIDAVIQAGDHNLVGTRDPLDTLATIGLAFDRTPLAHASLLQLNGMSAATWTGSGGRFPPGRLDYFNYSASRLEVLGGFVFDVADLTEAQRMAHRLQPDDSRRSSDHRPLVVDLRWR